MPLLPQLHVLKSSSGKVVKVKERVCAYWDDVATQLSFSPGLIDIIRRENDRLEKAFDDVMKRWLNGTEGTRKPITWKTLLTVLEDADHSVLADDIKNILPDVLRSKSDTTVEM